MTKDQIRIFSLGDTALTVEFGNTISASLNENAIQLAEDLEQDPFPGFIEAVPAYASTTVFYDVSNVRTAFPDFRTAFEAVRSIANHRIDTLAKSQAKLARNIEIAVHFDREAALDLDEVAERNKLTAKEVIEIFTSTTYRVYMLGFLPGFTYMGEVDERIATPRKETPRTALPKGSVGIAGRQTGIYSLESPGGWQLIGWTPLKLFDPESESPFLFSPGDEVKFIVENNVP